MLRFDERVAIVTGSAKGLGQAHSRLIGSRGGRLVLNCLPHEEDEARDLAREIEGSGGATVVVAGDIGAPETPQALVDAAMDTWGRIDIAVSNAGNVGQPSSLPSQDATSTLEEWLDVHVRAGLRLNAAAWPHMQKQGYGRLLMTGSAAATGYIRFATGFDVDYALAKSSLYGVVRQTAAEGLAHNITCNMVMPWAYTHMVALGSGGSDLGRWMEANVKAEQVAAGVAPLLHEDCPCTGEAITAAGGRVARVFFAATRGMFDPAVTPESALENWADVMGRTTEDGTLGDAFEQTQPREEAVNVMTLENQQLPGLAEIATLPLKGGSKSMEKG